MGERKSQRKKIRERSESKKERVREIMSQRRGRKSQKNKDRERSKPEKRERVREKK